MKVFRYLGPRHMEIADVPRPTIAEGEVLVRTRACGVCATDVKTFMRGHPIIHTGAVLGHEISGSIVESRTTGWQAGDRVVVAPYVPCGECHYCQRSQFTLCENLSNASVEPGGFSEYLRVPSRIVRTGMHCLPEHVDWITGALVEPLACSYHGLEALAVQRGESLLIIGDGPMGLLQAVIARRMGAGPIVLAGMTPERLAWGAQHVDRVINVSEKNLHDEIMTLSHSAGMDKIIVSVGQAEVAEQSLALVRRGGAVNFFAGLPSGSRMTIDPNRIHYDQITLVGTFGFAPGHFKRAVDALTSGALNITGYITGTVTLDRLKDAFADSAAYRGIKLVAVFG